MPESHPTRNVLLALATTLLTLLVLEIGLRMYDGRLFELSSVTARPPARSMQYDSQLGWIPSPGRVRHRGGPLPEVGGDLRLTRPRFAAMAARKVFRDPPSWWLVIRLLSVTKSRTAKHGLPFCNES